MTKCKMCNKEHENYNVGCSNSGYYNSGTCNSGDYNSGTYNSGTYNSGDCNSGTYNSGTCNSGDYNSGTYNSGDYNSGAFNADTPKMRIFNKEIEMTVSEFYSKYNLFMDIPLNRWINFDEMSEKEKAEIKGCEQMGGYLKTLDYKEACKIWWKENPNEHERFLTLPNFSWDIFTSITGIEQEESLSGKEVEIIIDGKNYKAIIK